MPDENSKIIESVNLKNTLVIITSDHGSYFPTVINNGKKINFVVMRQPTVKIFEILLPFGSLFID